MTFEEIQKELAALESAMLDKGIKMPTASVVGNPPKHGGHAANVVLSTDWYADGYAPFRGKRWHTCIAQEPREALSMARVYLAAMDPIRPTVEAAE